MLDNDIQKILKNVRSIQKGFKIIVAATCVVLVLALFINAQSRLAMNDQTRALDALSVTIIDTYFLTAYIQYLEPDKTDQKFKKTLTEMVTTGFFTWDMRVNHPVYTPGITYADLAETKQDDFIKALANERYLDIESKKLSEPSTTQ